MTRAMKRALVMILLLVAPVAAAHQQQTSYSNWERDGGDVRASLRVGQLELTRLGLHPGQADYGALVTARFAERVQVYTGERSCALAGNALSGTAKGWLQLRMRWDCGLAEDPLRIRFALFQDRAPGHVHLASIRFEEGPPAHTVFSGRRAEWSAAAAGGVGPQPAFRAYFPLGVEHILGGWDHLCFLLVLLLGATRLARLAWLVTGFTIGHSVTLLLAASGFAVIDTRAVEWVIALSILVIAIENVWRGEGFTSRWPFLLLAGVLVTGVVSGALLPLAALGLALFVFAYLCLLTRQADTSRLQLLVTMAFGLFHGFGFAGVLGDLQIGSGELLLPLLGFNLGVEAGQLLVLAAALPLLWWLRMRRPAVLALPNAVAAGAACFWLVQRSLV